MGQKWKPEIQSFKTNANFSANPWHIVKFAADDDIDLCGAGELMFGALTDEVGEADTDDKYVDVQVGGIVKVEAGATVTGGTLVMSNAAGEAIPVTTGNYALGQAIQGGADGELISVLWSVSYYEEG
jgi:hypothetical protein